MDTRSGVNDADYHVPFRFTGTISKLSISSASLLPRRSGEACQAVKMYSCNAFDSSSIARSR
jgi:hypothetical protein